MTLGQILSRSVGCTSLLCVFLIGLLIGYGVYRIDDATRHYIDRDTAIGYGQEFAREKCSDEKYRHPVDCLHFRLTDIREDPDGWFLTFVSKDNRQEQSMLVGRKGEYANTGGNWLDDRL